MRIILHSCLCSRNCFSLFITIQKCWVKMVRSICRLSLTGAVTFACFSSKLNGISRSSTEHISINATASCVSKKLLVLHLKMSWCVLCVSWLPLLHYGNLVEVLFSFFSKSSLGQKHVVRIFVWDSCGKSILLQASVVSGQTERHLFSLCIKRKLNSRIFKMTYLFLALEIWHTFCCISIPD